MRRHRRGGGVTDVGGYKVISGNAIGTLNHGTGIGSSQEKARQGASGASEIDEGEGLNSRRKIIYPKLTSGQPVLRVSG